jgi:hypothetical protein
VIWGISHPEALGAAGAPDRTTTPSAQPVTTSPAGKPLFTTNLHSCRVLTAAQVRTLLGDGLKSDHRTRVICQYRGANGSYATVSVYRLPTLKGAKVSFVGIKQTLQDQRDEHPDIKSPGHPWSARNSPLSTGRSTACTWLT